MRGNMADTRDSWRRFIRDDTPKTDRRSDYLKAKAFSGGAVVNTCPYGCEDHQLDDRGFCKHLVGHSHPCGEEERPTVFSPLKYDRTLSGEIKYDVLVNDGNDIQEVLLSDELVRISVSHMVYRKNPGERQAVKRHKIPDKMMTVLGVKNEEGDVVPATIADLQPKRKTWSRKKKVKSEAETQPA